ncbi:hypothetical protein ACO0LB_17865 [Undibacterium sp. SXout7W]|uniref:hypothetical protein n=1 Tax=Undibacterium sp. SXout7W TaxID=3413049 RepID=UPI003BF1173F
MTQNDLHLCRIEGKKAFQKHGVTGVTKHCYPNPSDQRRAFIEGHTQANFEAAERAQLEALAYQKLSMRDNKIDRAWAAKLTQA